MGKKEHEKGDGCEREREREREREEGNELARRALVWAILRGGCAFVTCVRQANAVVAGLVVDDFLKEMMTSSLTKLSFTNQ